MKRPLRWRARRLLKRYRNRQARREVLELASLVRELNEKGLIE